eukprot:CAMPEP_0176116412 /NCGR_PEP_ID=MMETSP0120_2-20121206/58471_1 /TAXON_ID=160619 /ORGANISM="Kryptoperidinium foliaceum, Strain CCMP 1326" /LENGTH=50 /DNA_ID=CAMNT_0017450675 /DNA_START=245 /DNA_END=394 /DNA_ORIENTATION=+
MLTDAGAMLVDNLLIEPAALHDAGLLGKKSLPPLPAISLAFPGNPSSKDK